MASVYENKKNKQRDAAEGKADFGRLSTCLLPAFALKYHFTLEIQELCCSGHVEKVREESPELQPAVINNQPQNMSALDLFLLFEVRTC